MYAQRGASHSPVSLERGADIDLGFEIVAARILWTLRRPASLSYQALSAFSAGKDIRRPDAAESL